MIYLKNFTLMDEDATYKEWCRIVNQNTEDENYPLGLFALKLSEVAFDDITIFYGSNGSGKSTLLNLIAETLEMRRISKYQRTKMFDFFVGKNSYELATMLEAPNEVVASSFDFTDRTVRGVTRLKRVPQKSKYIASDDIFKHILNIREENREIRERKNDEARYYNSYSFFDEHKSLNFEDKEALEAFSKYMESCKKSRKQFVKSRAGELERQFSNGENALMYFDKQIEENALYLLDEPENSMSPQFQLELKMLIEDSVRLKNCQFVIATHSPFILALQHAKIYNLDVAPVKTEQWYQLENMKIYYDFFKLFRYNFETDTP